MVRVPDDAVPGSFLRVRLAGKEYNVSLPTDISRGESVVVVAPAPSSFATPAPASATAPVIAVAVATDASGFPVPVPSPAPTQSGPREVNALELRAGDTPARYPYTVPAGAPRNVATQVRLAGREFTVKIPDFVRVGEVVTVVAPAAVV